VIVFDSNDARTVTSRVMDKDGRWTGIAAMHCPRAG
jgi:hypothetical protein